MSIRVGSQSFSETNLPGGTPIVLDEIQIDDNFDRLTVLALSSLLNGVLELQTKLAGTWVTVITTNLTAGTVDVSSIYHFFHIFRFKFTPAAGVTTDLGLQINVVKHVAQ